MQQDQKTLKYRVKSVFSESRMFISLIR